MGPNSLIIRLKQPIFPVLSEIGAAVNITGRGIFGVKRCFGEPMEKSKLVLEIGKV